MGEQKSVRRPRTGNANENPLGLTRDRVRRLTGSNVREVQSEMVMTVCTSIPNSAMQTASHKEAAILAALAMLEEIGPRNVKEGMIAVQMVTIHNATMECFQRAMTRQQPVQATDMYLRNAARLASLFEKHSVALEKMGRRGQQTIRVEHVATTPEAHQRMVSVDRTLAKATEKVTRAAPTPSNRTKVVRPKAVFEHDMEAHLVEEPECLQAVARA